MSMIAAMLLVPAVFTFTPDFSVAMEERKFEQARILMEQRLAADPNDGKGIAMKTRLFFAGVIQADEDTLTDALEACIDANPDAFECHLALGEMYGREASSGGMMRGMMLADDILERFQDAVRIQPKNLQARNNLQSFYLAAPGIAGGGRDKADANYEAFAALEPGLAPLLKVSMLMRDQKQAEAEKILTELPDQTDPSVRQLHAGALTILAFERINGKDLDSGRRVGALLSERYPRLPFGLIAIGRVELEGGDAKLAAEKLEQALAMDPNCGANYRLGLAYEKLGRVDDARKQYQSFVAVESRKGLPIFKEAQARLKAIGKS